MRKTVANQLRLGWARIASTSASDFSRYRDDPVAFFRECLFTEPWTRQKEVIEAVAKSSRVSVASGRRTGKTCLLAGIALWFWRTRGPGCRVILTAPKFDQIQDIVWRDIRRLYLQAKRNGVDLGGDLAVLASTGLRDTDDREIIGVTADQPEKLQGYAAPEIMFIVDEASKVEDRNFDAIMGNLAGDGKLLLAGNPTRSEGRFYEIHRKASNFTTFQISSLESPNIVACHTVVPGLAEKSWADEMAVLWGAPDGPAYRIHVLGEFVEGQEGRLFTVSMIADAASRVASTRPTGPLVIGCDPAGDGGDGDQSGFAARRGQLVLNVFGRRGLSVDAHLVELLGLIAENKGDSWEIPRIIVDRDGPIGAKVFELLRAYAETHKKTFAVIGIRGSMNARKRPNEIYHVRDELWFTLVESMRAGLAVPVSAQLEGDLASIKFDKLVGGKSTVIPKRVIRRELGRSPDLGDALALCNYEGPTWIDEAAQEETIQDHNRREMTARGGGDMIHDMGASVTGDVYDLANQAMGGGMRRREE